VGNDHVADRVALVVIEGEGDAAGVDSDTVIDEVTGQALIRGGAA